VTQEGEALTTPEEFRATIRPVGHPATRFISTVGGPQCFPGRLVPAEAVPEAHAAGWETRPLRFFDAADVRMRSGWLFVRDETHQCVALPVSQIGSVEIVDTKARSTAIVGAVLGSVVGAVVVGALVVGATVLCVESESCGPNGTDR
jgi:hypothetical protein